MQTLRKGQQRHRWISQLSGMLCRIPTPNPRAVQPSRHPLGMSSGGGGRTSCHLPTHSQKDYVVYCFSKNRNQRIDVLWIQKVSQGCRNQTCNSLGVMNYHSCFWPWSCHLRHCLRTRSGTCQTPSCSMALACLCHSSFGTSWSI